MNGDRTVMVKILNAIEHGTLSVDETRRRLEELVDKEIQKPDSPANIRLVEECEKLLWELDTNGKIPYTSHLMQDMTAVHKQVQRTHKKMKTRTFFMRAGALAVSMLILVVGSELLLRRTHVINYSTDDEQQFIVKGQEFDPDLISVASAGNDIAPSSISTANYAEVISYLGCDPNLGPSPLPGWVIDHYDCSRNSILSAITVFYISETHSDYTLMLNLVSYDSFDDASMFFEQNMVGHHETICKHDVYVTENVERNVAMWLHNKTIITLSGNIEVEELYKFIKILYGGIDYE